MKRETRKNKRWLWLLLLAALLIPLHVQMTDGGSEGWHALLWQVDHCHELSDEGFLVGTRVKLLFGLITVYDDTAPEDMASSRENGEENPAPYLVEESFFSDFAVKGDHVYFLCRLTVRNPSDTPVPVEISGDFSADAQGELIPHSSIPAFDAWPPLQLTFRVIPPDGEPEDTDFFSYAGSFQVYYDVDDDLAYFSPNPYVSAACWYRFPAGTYDALWAALRNGDPQAASGDPAPSDELRSQG